MSAASSRLRRPAAGTTTASIAPGDRPGVAVERDVAGDLRRQPPGRADGGALRLRTATAVPDGAIVERGMGALEIRTRTFFTGWLIAHLQSRAKQVISPAMDQRVIVITGPTASGKSALALALAERHRGTVINADAMQTYDAFPILTAQPTTAERSRVPHALYGVLPLSETLSAARWRALADVEIERCLAAGRTPILCGGSGLYLRTLMQGNAPFPIRRPACASRPMPNGCRWVRKRSGRACREGSGNRPAETRRPATPHVRAWEVWIATGRPLSAWQAGEGEPSRWRFATVLLAPERGWLRDRIEKRFDAMLASGGVLAEVRAVFDRAPDPRWPGLKAHGAPSCSPTSGGGSASRDARRFGIDHTRQYAKRQMTWFRHQMALDLVSIRRLTWAWSKLRNY